MPMSTEIEDAATRRAFLELMAAAGVLSGCASRESGGKDTPATTRTVEGAYGPVEIPTDPQRIFADLMTVDYLTALDADTSKIVGVFEATSFREDGHHYLADFFANERLVDPGFQFEMNLETVAAARPDLILLPFDQIDGAEQLNELKAIAPLLVVPTAERREPDVRYGGTASFQDWRSTLRAYAALLGLEERAEDYIAATDGQLAAISAEYGSLIEEITVTQAKSTPEYMVINALSVANAEGVLGTIILSELGFHAPPQQLAIEPDEYGGIELSQENLDLVDADLLFLEVRDGSTEHEKSPLWPTLEVVRNDGVVIVGNHWEFGGAVAARQVIADIDQAMGDLAARR